ncbi:MAG: SGNH/GDSL hydrolase family protein [Acidobacteriaceae bacterium]
MQSKASLPAWSAFYRKAMCVFATGLLTVALIPSAAAKTAKEIWVGAWATAPFAHDAKAPAPDFANATYRQIVHTNIAGKDLRIRFTNEFGTEPLVIDAAHVALSAGNGAIEPGTDHAVTFNGKSSISIPAGALALSDPVALATPAFANMAVSIHLPAQQISIASYHADAAQTNYLQPGNAVSATTLESPSKVYSWYFLKGIDVEPAVENASAVVAYGDSITDGAYATVDENHRWPDFLAQRLQADPKTAHLSVLDEGIGGNRVLRDGTGPSALARFDRDVLAQAGVKYVIVLESINDIGRLKRNNDPEDAVTAEDLEQGLQQLVARAHEHGIKIFGATLTPYKGAGYYTDKGEEIREAVNKWILTSGVFDGIVDFDKATRDPADSLMYLPKYDHGDHLHPSDTGYKAMGDAINLNLFK